MRPVVKGPAPRDEYDPYSDALDDLFGRIGPFCSYCEQVITHAPEVEHVQPKSLVPSLRNSWDNFLLACKSCNTVKGNDPVNLDQVAFPDIDNTFIALDFYRDGRVEVAAGFVGEGRPLIEALVELVKLDRHPSAPRAADRPSKRDVRVKLRLDVWDIALLQLKNYERFRDVPEVSDVLAETISEHLAPAKGFFSIWMKVFRNYPEMLRRFIMSFPGTDTNCFDADGLPVARPDGRF